MTSLLEFTTYLLLGRKTKLKYRKRLVPGAYKQMTLAKKLYFWLESWCSDNYGAYYHTRSVNRGTNFELFEIPWYGKYISGLEFYLRYKLYPKPKLGSGIK